MIGKRAKLFAFWQSVAKYCREGAFFKKIQARHLSRCRTETEPKLRAPLQKFFDAVDIRV